MTSNIIAAVASPTMINLPEAGTYVLTFSRCVMVNGEPKTERYSVSVIAANKVQDFLDVAGLEGWDLVNLCLI